jgi:hypothetical protein
MRMGLEQWSEIGKWCAVLEKFDNNSITRAWKSVKRENQYSETFLDREITIMEAQN